MNRPTELAIEYAKHLCRCEGWGLSELMSRSLRETLLENVERETSELGDPEEAFLLYAVKYMLAYVDWVVAEDKMKQFVNSGVGENGGT